MEPLEKVRVGKETYRVEYISIPQITGGVDKVEKTVFLNKKLLNIPKLHESKSFEAATLEKKMERIKTVMENSRKKLESLNEKAASLNIKIKTVEKYIDGCEKKIIKIGMKIEELRGV